MHLHVRLEKTLDENDLVTLETSRLKTEQLHKCVMGTRLPKVVKTIPSPSWIIHGLNVWLKRKRSFMETHLVKFETWEGPSRLESTSKPFGNLSLCGAWIIASRPMQLAV